MNNAFWIFSHLGLGDHIVCCGLYRHFSNLYKDRAVIIPVWEHNLASVQWLLNDCGNVFFYPLESESQLLACRDSISYNDRICLGFYQTGRDATQINVGCYPEFNPVLWDSEFYRQAKLDPSLSYSGFRVPDFKMILPAMPKYPMRVYHHDLERGFAIKDAPFDIVHREDKGSEENPGGIFLSKNMQLKDSCNFIYHSGELHLIDSSMLCLADRLETPYCKRFVFHRYARKGLPPQLKKNWEVLD